MTKNSDAQISIKAFKKEPQIIIGKFIKLFIHEGESIQ